MKKASIIITLAFLVFACSRKTVNTSETATAPATAPATTAAAPETSKAEAEHAALVAQGQTVYTNRCGRCHGLKDVTAYTATRWEGILKSMMPKARLNEIESQQVTAYVMDNAKK